MLWFGSSQKPFADTRGLLLLQHDTAVRATIAPEICKQYGSQCAHKYLERSAAYGKPSFLFERRVI